MPETWVQSLDWKDPLEKEMATHSSIPVWEIPWREEPDGLQSMGLQKWDMTQQLNNRATGQDQDKEMEKDRNRHFKIYIGSRINRTW